MRGARRHRRSRRGRGASSPRWCGAIARSTRPRCWRAFMRTWPTPATTMRARSLPEAARGLVDLGAGAGHYAAAFLDAAPAAEATLVDRAEVLALVSPRERQ